MGVIHFHNDINPEFTKLEADMTNAYDALINIVKTENITYSHITTFVQIIENISMWPLIF